MEAVVLAGGLGTRLREVVTDVPKPMAPIGDRPFLEILLDYWIGQGVRRFILSVGYKHELIQRHFGRSYGGVEIDYAVEQVPLGTGGGLLLAGLRLRSGGAFLVLNGDTLFETKLADIQSFHRASGADITLGLRKVTRNSRYGEVVLDEAGRIEEFRPYGGSGRRDDARQSIQINGGVYVFNTSVFNRPGFRAGQKVSLEAEILGQMLAGGMRLYGFRANAKFIDIGIPDDYARAPRLLGGR